MRVDSNAVAVKISNVVKQKGSSDLSAVRIANCTAE